MKGTVGIAAVQLIDPEKHHILSHDRWAYAVELSRLLLDLDYDVCWWQVGKNWRSELIPGVPLIGNLRGEVQLFTRPYASEDFWNEAGHVDWAIYFDLILAYPQAHECSVAIAHNIYWDDPLWESRLAAEAERDEWKRRLLLAIHGPQITAAADTGFIQWTTTEWPGLYHKFVYIPNFVPADMAGETAVHPAASFHDEKLRILCPQPLQPQEGISETVRAIDYLTSRYTHMAFTITGSGSARVDEAMRQWADAREQVVFQPQHLSRQILADADIVLCPGKYNQGTSFMCLAALAAGKALVVGQTGGMTDLVLHGHNGLVINPNTASIVAAIEALNADRDLCAEMGRNSRLIANCFSLDRWRERWRELLDRTFR